MAKKLPVGVGAGQAVAGPSDSGTASQKSGVMTRCVDRMLVPDDGRTAEGRFGTV